MNRLARQFAFSGVIYDENNFHKKMENLFGEEFKFYAQFECSTDFFAISVTNGGVLDLSIRGTDGDNLLEKIMAWLRNADKKPDDDGFHPGFKQSAQWCLGRFEEVVDRLPIFTECYVNGHSAGAGIGPQLGRMVASLISPIQVHCFSFASPPTCNYVGFEKLQTAHRDYGFTNIYIVNPRDIVTQICRNSTEKLKRGVDFGSPFILPPDSGLQRLMKRFWSVHEHRPREYCDGFIIEAKGYPETVNFLKRCRKMLVN